MKQTINNIIVEEEEHTIDLDNEIKYQFLENNSGSDSDDDTINKKIDTTITTMGVSTIYLELLKNDDLLLKPEYQRELSWTVEKMNAFVDTIFKGWIVPNYVIYELSKNEKNDNKLQNLEHTYECIDGQHRLTTIKMFIEGLRHPNLEIEKHIYLKIGNDRVYYNMDDKKLALMNKNHKHRKIIHRNFTKDERKQFDKFQMSLHFIKPIKNGLDMKIKCEIFNRLQKGEKVESYVTLRNHNNPISNYIRSNKILTILNNLKFIDKIECRKTKHDESFNMFLLIRSVLIVDKKIIDVNFLDLNIKKYIENNYSSIQLHNDINESYNKVMIFIEWFSNNLEINLTIIPELYFIYLCIYTNYDTNEVSKVIRWFNLDANKKHFIKYNSIKTYKNIISEEVDQNSKVSNTTKVREAYEWIVKYVSKKTTDLE